MKRRALLGAALAFGIVRPAWAGRAIKLIVGASPGAPRDIAARSFAPFLERHLPHARVTVVNRPGGAGLAAYRELAAADPSGLTLGWVATPTLPARTVDRQGTDTLLRRLRLLGAVAKEPIAFVSSSGSPLATAPDLVARSAEDAAAVPLATPPAGSPAHLTALMLQAIAGTRLNIVAFPSAAAAREAALSGNAAAASLELGDAIEALRDGTLSGLGLAAHARTAAFPDIPPLRDGGLELAAAVRRGLAVPNGLADDMAAPLAEALRAVVADPEFLDQADASGFVATWMDGPDWTTLAQGECQELRGLWRVAPWLPSEMG